MGTKIITFFAVCILCCIDKVSSQAVPLPPPPYPPAISDAWKTLNSDLNRLMQTGNVNSSLAVADIKALSSAIMLYATPPVKAQLKTIQDAVQAVEASKTSDPKALKSVVESIFDFMKNNVLNGKWAARPAPPPAAKPAAPPAAQSAAKSAAPPAAPSAAPSLTLKKPIFLKKV